MNIDGWSGIISILQMKGGQKMTYEEFINEIVKSDPSDWLCDDSKLKGKFVLKSNLAISISEEELDYGEEGRFYEEWAESFPDPVARRLQFELCYNGNEIESFYTVSVDGSRMFIPLPKLGKMTITKKQYAIGRIVNILNEAYGYDSYLDRAGVTIE